MNARETTVKRTSRQNRYRYRSKTCITIQTIYKNIINSFYFVRIDRVSTDISCFLFGFEHTHTIWVWDIWRRIYKGRVSIHDIDKNAGVHKTHTIIVLWRILSLVLGYVDIFTRIRNEYNYNLQIDWSTIWYQFCKNQMIVDVVIWYFRFRPFDTWWPWP